MIPTREEIRTAYDAGFEAVVALFESTFQAMDDRLKHLETRLNQTSQNSHKPPSSDGYRKPARKTKSLRQKTGRASGGQAGHPGETLKWEAEPDEIRTHWPERCGCCGRFLSHAGAGAGAGAGAADSGYERRQVHEVPPVKLAVTEHRAMRVRCEACGTETTGVFPAGVRPGVQYGSGVKALLTYLACQHLLPLARTVEVLGDLVGARPSDGTLANVLAECAERLAPVEQRIHRRLMRAAVGHADETGMRVANRLSWLHSFSTPTLTYYAVDAQRGRAAYDRIGLLAQFRGTVVHDAYASYLNYEPDGRALTHALCNAHLLRELTGLAETPAPAPATSPDPHRWASPMKDLLIEIKAAVDQAHAVHQPALPPALIETFEQRFRQLVQHGLRANPPPERPPGRRGHLKKTPARNLLERLRDHEADVLRFMHDFRVPFDNHQAERDLRMMKVKQKVSGCFRSLDGARIFCRIRGVLSTIRKQGGDVLAALRATFDGEKILPRLA